MLIGSNTGFVDKGSISATHSDLEVTSPKKSQFLLIIDHGNIDKYK